MARAINVGGINGEFLPRPPINSGQGLLEKCNLSCARTNQTPVVQAKTQSTNPLALY